MKRGCRSRDSGKCPKASGRYSRGVFRMTACGEFPKLACNSNSGIPVNSKQGKLTQRRARSNPVQDTTEPFKSMGIRLTKDFPTEEETAADSLQSTERKEFPSLKPMLRV